MTVSSALVTMISLKIPSLLHADTTAVSIESETLSTRVYTEGFMTLTLGSHNAGSVRPIHTINSNRPLPDTSNSIPGEDAVPSTSTNPRGPMISASSDDSVETKTPDTISIGGPLIPVPSTLPGGDIILRPEPATIVSTLLRHASSTTTAMRVKPSCDGTDRAAKSMHNLHGFHLPSLAQPANVWCSPIYRPA